MRPDMNSWRSTAQLTTVEFSPRRLLYRRLLGWTIRLLLIHTVLSLAFWAALRTWLLPITPDELRHWEQLARLAPAQPSPREALVGLMSAPVLRELMDLGLAQLASLLLIHLLLIPPIRRRLSEHVAGMTELFNAIRSLASGTPVKPLSAGQRGELGYLAVAFNDMTARLLAGQKALREANYHLEQRVEERTRELRNAAAQLDKMASTDALTGLANRRHLTESSQEIFARSVATGSDLVCLLIDLDNFKMVNDTHGHKVGDDVLRAAAEAMKTVCRDHDLPARLGGDEFVIVMQMPNADAVPRIAERLLAQFSRSLAAALGPGDPLASMSIGIASRKATGAVTFEDLMIAGDLALYSAKAQGKSCYALWHPDLRPADKAAQAA